MHSYAGNNVQGQFVDLANRLEHLITYSSQLIFVSGEAMSHQTSFVQRFLGNQNEHANIVYLDARKKIDLPSFRRRVGQQLSRDKPIDLSKPLTESLSRLLTTENEFVLVAVTHAEGLSNDILKELWDLVLQNRFARHRHHLNVLVFGETNWAEGAKAWLPANSNSKPVLLTSETVTKASEQHLALSDLDELIASKRAQFDKRIAKRSRPAASANPLKKWWVKLLIASVFILSFGGILIGQYFDLTKEALTEFSSFLFQSQIEQSQAHEEQVAQQAEIEQPAAENVADPIDVSSKTTNIDSEAGVVSESASSIFNLPQGQVTVTEWKDAIKSLPTVPLEVGIEDSDATASNEDLASTQPIEPIDSEQYSTSESTLLGESVGLNLSELTLDNASELSTTNNLATLPINQVTETSTTATSVEESTTELDIEPALNESNSLAPTDTVNVSESAAQQATLIEAQEEARIDYPVEDIVSVEQLAQLNADTPQTAESSVFDNEWAKSLDNDRFVLQISAMSSEQVLKEYLADNQLTDRVRVYQIERFGGPWHVVLWNKTFATIEEARNEVNALPQSIQAAEPFAKRVSQIKPLL